jgi:hypothetical protein
MSSISSVNPGVADLLQTFTNTGSTAMSSVLSLPAVQSAIENESPQDLAVLSFEAQQLQEAVGLFGTTDASETPVDPSTLLLQALSSSLSGSTATVPAATTT